MSYEADLKPYSYCAYYMINIIHHLIHYRLFLCTHLSPASLYLLYSAVDLKFLSTS